MIGFANFWGQMAPVVTAALGGASGEGETVILRRPGTLEDVSSDATPGVFELGADAAPGATLLTLVLASGGKLRGTAPAGSTLTIAGTSYRLSAEAVAAAGAISLTATIPAPGLAASASLGDAVTLDAAAVHTLTRCQVSGKQQRDLAVPLQEMTMVVVTVPKSGAAITPRVNDFVELADGTRGRIAARPIDAAGFWKLQISGA